jgi:hypothetical protein
LLHHPAVNPAPDAIWRAKTDADIAELQRLVHVLLGVLGPARNSGAAGCEGSGAAHVAEPHCKRAGMGSVSGS